MASSSAVSAPTFTVPNITSLVTTKLEGPNYMSWTTQFVPALSTHDLLGMVYGSEICPSKFVVDAEGKPTSTINPEFLVWQKKDQFVLAWLNATLSEKVLSMVYGLTTAQQVWAHLAKRFTPTSQTHISNLKRQLQTISQGSKSCTDYLLTTKSLADQLAAIGKGVEDEDLISYVIGGLNPSYHTFVTTFCYGNRDTSITFEDFQTELLNYEQLFEAHHKPQNTDGGQFAFHLHKPKSQHFPKKYRAPQYGRHSPRQQYSSAPPQPHQSGQQPVPPPQSKFPTSSHYGKPPNSAAPFSSSTRPPCQICGKLSHQALDCYHRMDFAFQGRHPPAQLAAMAAYTPENPEVEHPWYLDSGANHHVTSELEKLTLQEPYQGTDSVTVGNGSGLQIANTGSSLISTPSSQFILHKVLHCPNASANLLSIQQFCRDNHCYFILTSTHFTIKDMQTKEILLHGPSEAGLYPIYLKQLQSNKVKTRASFLSSTTFLSHFTAFLGVTAPLHIWHSRLGHPSHSALNKLLQHALIPCNGSSKINKLCDSCQISKSKKLPFPDSHRISTHPFELIHSDVWTSPILSLGGCKYYVLFVDDYSRFSWLYPLKSKSEVLPCFSKFKKLVENLFSCSIKQLQTDNGGEYTSMAFKNFTNEHGILHRFTCPYTSEQNGISERKHRHITETALTLLAQSHLAPHYWVDAFLTAIYLINRLPTPVLQHQSPYFKLLQKHPNYTLLKTFGCACYPLLRPYVSHKLSFRSTKCVFIGYSSTQKGYRCLDLNTNRVYTSRHVIFDELQFPAHEGPAPKAPAVTDSPGVAISIPPGISHLPPTVSPLSTDVVSPISTNSSPASPAHLEVVSPSSPLLLDSDPASPSSPTPGSSSNIPLSSPPTAEPTPDVLSQPAAALMPTVSSEPPPSRMLTRSQTNSLQPKTFPDYKLYSSTRYPLLALTSVTLPAEPRTYHQAAQNPCWLDAMKAEFSALVSNHTWTLVPRPTNQKVVRNKWVFKLKQRADGTIDRYKARLVAKGFDQEAGVDFHETFSPVIKPATIRLVLALAVHFHWVVHQLDISNAFLHGYLEEEVLMEQPKGFEDPAFPDHVCRLHKSLYGLKQAPRAWFMRLSQALLELGFTSSAVDSSLFMFHLHSIHVFVLIYVDDILVCSNSPSAISGLISHLQCEFAVKDLGPLSYFLGIQATRTHNALYLTQTKYITDLLRRTHMDGAKPASTPCTTAGKLSRFDGDPLNEPSEYRHIVGALQYCTLTRPDIAYSVNQLCQFLHSPTTVHMIAAKRVLRYLKGTLTLGLCYTRGSLHLNGYCDSDWAGSPDDRKSTTGYGMYLGPCLISWAAKKQAVVAKSSTEAEYRSMALAVAELYWLRMLFQELRVPLLHPPCLWVDNLGALSLSLL
jgi:hypothetical protein